MPHSSQEEYKAFQKKYQRERHRQRKLALVELLGTFCTDCKMNLLEWPECADFDHLPGFDKSFTIGNYVGTKKWDEILEEAAKTELVCANCHRTRTKERGDEARG